MADDLVVPDYRYYRSSGWPVLVSFLFMCGPVGMLVFAFAGFLLVHPNTRGVIKVFLAGRGLGEVVQIAFLVCLGCGIVVLVQSVLPLFREWLEEKDEQNGPEALAQLSRAAEMTAVLFLISAYLFLLW